jgi:hypothetical protein
MTKKQPANSPSSNPSSAPKRAMRTEAFRQKNARRKARRAEMRNNLTRGLYLEWRYMCRQIRFYPAKARQEFFETGRISSHNDVSTDRSPLRSPK